MRDALARLFEQTFGAAPVAAAAVQGEGSRRRMLRLTGPAGRTAVGVHGPDPLENRAFLAYGRRLHAAGLPVPRVYAADEEAGAYLVEDLGETTLHDALAAARAAKGSAWPSGIRATYRKVLQALARLQVEGGRAVDYAVAYPRPRYDAQAMQWDCNYFKYDFLKLVDVPFHESRLETDFATLIDWLDEPTPGHFMHRDMQSKNVMLVDDEPHFIDFQGGLAGPLEYDVAKLLYEGKTALPAEARTALLDDYLTSVRALTAVDEDRFRARLRGFVVLRILQGLGAYGLLGLHRRKPAFIARIPPALREIETLLEGGLLPVDVPELTAVMERLVAREDLRHAPTPGAGGLTVRIGSFSYKRGLPPDEGGHGGGFVFDCRALPNPGRLDAYKPHTGLDPAVRTWLEAQDALGPFRDHVIGLVMAQVDTYRARGFDSLQVLFGCTGGQHRSVYMAEHLAARLREQHPDLACPVTHAEAANWPEGARAWTR